MRPGIRELLVCPTCRGALEWFGQLEDALSGGVLVCLACRLPYPISHGIPEFVNPRRIGGRNARLSAMYDAASWFYRALSRAAFVSIGLKEETGRRELIDRLQPHGRVLEVSIGPGVNLPYLVTRPAAGEIVGLDISRGQLLRCAAYARRKRWPVDLVLGNGEQLPFTDDSFDSVFHIGGINFFDNKAAALAEMARVAKPGTRLLVADETERGARAYEKLIPGFSRATGGDRRPPAVPPVDDLPAGVTNVAVRDVWNGWFYCLEFTIGTSGSPAGGS